MSPDPIQNFHCPDCEKKTPHYVETEKTVYHRYNTFTCSKCGRVSQTKTYYKSPIAGVVTCLLLLVVTLACSLTTPATGSVEPGPTPGAATHTATAAPPASLTPEQTTGAGTGQAVDTLTCATVTAVQALHVRTRPDPEAQVVGWLLAGSTAVTGDAVSNWTEILVPLHGWVNNNYIRTVKCGGKSQ